MGLLAGYIEQLGTGTNDLIKRCVDKGLRRPEFRQDDSYVTILWRPTKDASDQSSDQVAGHVTGQESVQKTSQKTLEVVEPIAENLSTMRGLILKILWKNPNATAAYISKEVGIASRNVQEHLRKMQGQGIIRRVGPDKGGHWEIVQPQ